MVKTVVKSILTGLSCLSIVFYTGCNNIDGGEQSDKAQQALYDNLDNGIHPVNDLRLASLSDTLKLSDLLRDKGNYLIVSMGDLGCRSCSRREIALLKSIDSDIFHNHLIVLGQFRSKREQKIFTDESKLNIYRRIDRKDPIEGYEGESIMFTIDSSLNSTNILRLKTHPELTRLYYNDFLNSISSD